MELNNLKNEAGYIMKINDISDITKMGRCIIDEDEMTVQNLIIDKLIEKKLLVSDLAKLTGISRQNVNAVTKGKMKPGIDFALKVAYVLDTKVEDLFVLTDNAWMKSIKEDGDVTLYVDLFNNEIIDSSVKKKRIVENEFEYMNLEDKSLYNKKERDERIRIFIDENLQNKISEIRKMEEINVSKPMNAKQINSFAIYELRREFSAKITKIYKRLCEKITPYQIP